MSNLHKDKVSKTLVRNVVERLPAPPVVPKTNRSCPEIAKVEPKFKKIVVSSVPDTNSINLITHHITNVKNKQCSKVKSVTELDEHKQLAIQEKLTRKMNFPHEHAVYKDLIPICVKPGPPPAINSREPLPQKDAEPQLADFYKNVPISEFKYILPPQPTNSSSSLIYDGLQMRRLMTNWK